MSVKEKIDEINSHLEPYRLDFIKININSAPPKNIWSSKFSGTPYWPKGKDYPKNNDNSPLFLLAQINFSEVPPLTGYPTEGILQFFIANDDLYGLDFDTPLEEIIQNPQGYRVIYHPDIFHDITKLESELPSPKDSYLPVNTECSESSRVSRRHCYLSHAT